MKASQYSMPQVTDPGERKVLWRSLAIANMLKGGLIGGIVFGVCVGFILVLQLLSMALPEDPYAAAPLEPTVQTAEISAEDKVTR
ncbi:MAG: hypothetical protein AAF557_00245 [Pseudomonadota bacterium]